MKGRGENAGVTSELSASLTVALRSFWALFLLGVRRRLAVLSVDEPGRLEA
jgi:hypothetical protein